jgi:hypothetical protein
MAENFCILDWRERGPVEKRFSMESALFLFLASQPGMP